MSITKTAYDTTIGRASVTAKAVHAIKEVLITAPYVELEPSQTINSEANQPILATISGRTSYEEHVPPFIHPLLVTGTNHKEYLFSDFRNFVRVVDDKQVVKNASEYKLARARLVMGKAWLTAGPDALFGISIVPMQVYGAWISQALRQRFALDALDQLRLSILATFYYQSLFVEASEFDEHLMDKFNAGCIRSLRAPAKLVFETTDKLKTMKLANINDFCVAVQTILENQRLEHFNAGLLITILKSSWWSANAADILAASLEHPPTWMALIYCALADRTYRNSNLAEITERFAKGGAEHNFTRGFVSLGKSITSAGDDENSF